MLEYFSICFNAFFEKFIRCKISMRKKIDKSLEIGRKKKEKGKKEKKETIERIIEYSATRFNANRNSSLKTSSTCTNIDEKQSINP